MKNWTVDKILNRSFDTCELGDEWTEFLGTPELNGAWIVWGQSGNGKTDFCLKLAKAIAQYERVAYCALEEGVSETLKLAILRNNMQTVAKKFVIWEKLTLEGLKEKLQQRRKPRAVFIDSLQYLGLSKTDYIELKEAFPTTLFVFISHAQGRNPLGRTADFVRYDSNVKVFVHGFMAFPISRFGGGEPFTIWEAGAERKHKEV